jgi:hypothetical protein
MRVQVELLQPPKPEEIGIPYIISKLDLAD